jgi:hypothetical protein
VPEVVACQVGLCFERLARPVHDLDVAERPYEDAQRASAEQLRGSPKRCRPGHVSRGLVDVAGIRQQRFAFVGSAQAVQDERVQEGAPSRLEPGLPVPVEGALQPDLRTNGITDSTRTSDLSTSDASRSSTSYSAMYSPAPIVSAASNVNPPANTARRRSRVCSSSVSSS